MKARITKIEIYEKSSMVIYLATPTPEAVSLLQHFISNADKAKIFFVLDEKQYEEELLELKSKTFRTKKASYTW